MSYASILNDLSVTDDAKRMSVDEFRAKYAPEWSLSHDTYNALVQIHRGAYLYEERCAAVRQFIEDVLTDINYHTECALLHKGMYKDALNMYG